MNVLILGCGYLGRRLGRRLAGSGASVTGTTRSGASDAALRAAGIRPERWDAAAPGAGERLRRLSAEAGWVVCAAAPSGGAGYEDVYVRAAEAMATALDPDRTRSALFVSSTSVYGVSDGSWVDESTPARPSRPAGRILLRAEEAVRAGEGRGLRVSVVRAAGIYGPGRTPAARLAPGAQPGGTGQEWLNLVHVDDLAGILVRTAERGPATVLASDGTPVRRRDYYAEAARLYGLPAPRFGGGDAGPHVQGAGKRLRSAVLGPDLEYRFIHPDYRAGLAASRREEAGPGEPSP